MPINSGNFKEGNTLAALKPEIKAIRIATKEMLFDAFFQFCNMSVNDVVKLETKDYSLLQQGVLQSLIKFRETGEYDYIKYMLDQIVGRARESIELTSEQDSKIEIVFTEKK